MPLVTTLLHHSSVGVLRLRRVKDSRMTVWTHRLPSGSASISRAYIIEQTGVWGCKEGLRVKLRQEVSTTCYWTRCGIYSKQLLNEHSNTTWLPIKFYIPTIIHVRFITVLCHPTGGHYQFQSQHTIILFVSSHFFISSLLFFNLYKRANSA